MHIALGADHAGYQLKEKVKLWLNEWGHACTDYGTDSTEPVDYPDIAASVVSGMRERAILICGTGIGMAMAANRLGARAALCWNESTAVASRSHNDANVLCLGARELTEDKAKAIVYAWLGTAFSKDERHITRIKKLTKLKNYQYIK